MSLSIDPSQVLAHLNDQGYRNITAEQLKAFIIDLKRLIKHDLKEKDENAAPNRPRCVKRNCSSCSSCGPTPPLTAKLPYQAPTQSFLAKCTLEKKTKRTPREEDNGLPRVMVPSRLSSAAQRDVEKKSCKMWIRPQTHRTFKSDPVSLFNNYQKDWAKFKEKIPVDNKHLDLRWAVRNRLSTGRFE